MVKKKNQPDDEDEALSSESGDDAELDAPVVTGFVDDFISGKSVRATPEEVDAVQVVARRLVEDFDYPKNLIQTHPQFRVRRSPSDESGSYPVDIAVFNGKKTEPNLYIVVECKKKNRKDGLEQLKRYLDMSPAEIGVWYNGDDHAYIRKVLQAGGKRVFEDLPTIPRRGQRIEDIGKFCRRDLRAPSNLKAVFRDLRNHLAGNTTGVSRDEALAQEIINLLFCKIYDEINTAPDETVTFRCGVGEKPDAVKKRIVELFEKKVKAEYTDVFSAKDAVTLDAASVVYIVGELQAYCIIEADRDAVGEAFEVFIGPALRGSEGQFFTPRNVVRMMISMLDPQPGEMLIDPACGSGGFLITALEHVWQKLREEGEHKKWSERQLAKKQDQVATRNFRGIDKDAFLAKVTKAYMAIMGDGRGGVFCENSLLPPSEWDVAASRAIGLGKFDIVVANPPFGKKIKVKGATTLGQYDLAHKWKRDKKTKTFTKTNELLGEQGPHVLFLERCMQLCKPGGRLGIVLPEGVIGNPSYKHVIEYMMEHLTVKAVVTMPEALFKTSGKGGTHTKVCVLILVNAPGHDKPYPVFMGDAKWCGHDSRGNPTIRKNEKGDEVLLDEVPEVGERYRLMTTGKLRRPDHRGFSLRSDEVIDGILVPKYYDPELEAYLKSLSKTHELVRIGDLVDAKIISIDNGTEVGKMAYGTGKIPFIRTSDLSNWEIKADFKHGVSAGIYHANAQDCDVKAGDIFMVKDGTYLVGSSAIVTESDLPMLFQSHLYRIRVEKPKELDVWLLFAALNSPVVRRQVRSKQFTQDIIDTVGKRVLELVVPFPHDETLRKSIAREVKKTVETRVALRNRATEISFEIEGLEPETRGIIDEEIV